MRRTLWLTNISLRCNGQSRAGLLAFGFLRQIGQTTSATFYWGSFQPVASFSISIRVAYYF